MTDNEKYVKRGQALIVGDDPQRHEEVAAANRNKVGAPFQYAESLFAWGIVQNATKTRTFKFTHMANAATCHPNATSQRAHQTPTTSDL